MKYLIKYKLIAGLFISLSLLTDSVIAADEARLYDKAPKHSAFVRVVNNHSEKMITAKVEDKALLSLGRCQVSDFSYVLSGKHTLKVNGKSWQGELKGDHVYTFIVNENEIHVIEEKVFNNPKKGLIAVYNLTNNESLEIKTGKKSKKVFKTVPQYKLKSREINPVKMDFAVYVAGEKKLSVPATVFQRGKVSNLFVCNKDERFLSSWNEN